MKLETHLKLVLSFFVLLLLTSVTSNKLMSQEKPHLYLFPGQGGDERLFKNLDLADYSYTIINYSDTIPDKKERMETYALRIAPAIDTTRPYAFIGVSLGGMLASELSRTLKPEKVIIISSIKNRHELPFRYKLLKYLPLHRLFGGKMIKKLSHIGRPLFEPSSRQDQELFKSMIEAKDPRYLKRASQCISNWDNLDKMEHVYHIHGTKDNTLPFKNVTRVYPIEGGSHLMIVFRAKEISTIIFEILNI